MKWLVGLVVLGLLGCASISPPAITIDREPVQVEPGKGVGPIQLGMSQEEVNALNGRVIADDLQDPLFLGGKLVGFSTNVGGSIAFGKAMVGYMLSDAVVETLPRCEGEVPEVQQGDVYEKAVAVWLWFPACGLGIRSVVIAEDGTESAAVQAWAVFYPNDNAYREYIETTFVNRRNSF